MKIDSSRTMAEVFDSVLNTTWNSKESDEAMPPIMIKDNMMRFLYGGVYIVWDMEPSLGNFPDCCISYFFLKKLVNTFSAYHSNSAGNVSITDDSRVWFSFNGLDLKLPQVDPALYKGSTEILNFPKLTNEYSGAMGQNVFREFNRIFSEYFTDNALVHFRWSALSFVTYNDALSMNWESTPVEDSDPFPEDWTFTTTVSKLGMIAGALYDQGTGLAVVGGSSDKRAPVVISDDCFNVSIVVPATLDVSIS